MLIMLALDGAAREPLGGPLGGRYGVGRRWNDERPGQRVVRARLVVISSISTSLRVTHSPTQELGGVEVS